MESDTFIVRSDYHGRKDLAKRDLELVASGRYKGVFDLGDYAVPYVDREDPLRQGQEEGEETKDAIIRNIQIMSRSSIQDVMDETLSSIEEMHRYYKATAQAGIYRGIAGNAGEVWGEIFDSISDNPNERAKLDYLFDDMNLIRESGAEFYYNGELHSYSEVIEDNAAPKSALLYLPWKAPIETVRQALDQVQEVDPNEIVVLSHDFLTKDSLPQICNRKMQNQEQITTVLDRLSRMKGKVTGYFGHIGLDYESYRTGFDHNGKRINTIHADEKNGDLLELRLK